MHESYRRGFFRHTGVAAGIEPVLQVAVGNHTVVNAIAVFLLLFRLEEFEPGGEHDRLAGNGGPIAEDDGISFLQPVNGCYFGFEMDFDVFQCTLVWLQYLAGRGHIGEQTVPLCHMPSQRRTLLHYHG